ncbi:MAG: hypothetical protein JXQ75_17740 [Phycisphaerae bacterium]|nr:hypothetical protein [Phycisphaerae bacterium]
MEEREEPQPPVIEYAASVKQAPVSRWLVLCGPILCVLCAIVLLGVRVAAAFHPGGWPGLTDSMHGPNPPLISRIGDTIASLVLLPTMLAGVVCVATFVYASRRRDTIARTINIVGAIGACIVFFWAMMDNVHLNF